MSAVTRWWEGEISRLAIMQIQPIQPSTIESERLLGDMVDTFLGIAGVVTTVARERALLELAWSVRVSRETFRQLPRPPRVWLAQRVLDIARTLIPNLEALGVTEEMIPQGSFRLRTYWTANGLALTTNRQAGDACRYAIHLPARRGTCASTYRFRSHPSPNVVANRLASCLALGPNSERWKSRVPGKPATGSPRCAARR